MPMTIGSDNKAVLDYSLTCADVDGHSQARLSCYENLVQEAAAMHATMKGMGIYDLQRENRTWVIARSRMTVSRYVRWPGDHIRVTTWPQESTGFNCPRHIEAEDASGRRLFECETKWAVIDFRTGRPMRAMDISSVLGLPAKEEQGIRELEEKVKEMFLKGEISFNDQIYITNIRQKNALSEALASMKKVIRSIEDGMPEDFYSIDLMDAYESLGSITGEAVGEDLINEIFSKFCMGK